MSTVEATITYRGCLDKSDYTMVRKEKESVRIT